jgi:plastocyanin
MRSTLSVAGMTALLLLVYMLSSADAAVIQIKMANVAYAPAQVSAHVGDTVEWTNDDIVAHTATARNGAWDLMMQPKNKASITLNALGTIEYYCRFHPNMVGSITVSQ